MKNTSVKVKITQVRSTISVPPRQKLYLKSLGLRKIGHSVEREANLSVKSLIKKLENLVKAEVKV